MAQTAKKAGGRPAQTMVVQSGNEIAATAAKQAGARIHLDTGDLEAQPRLQRVQRTQHRVVLEARGDHVAAATEDTAAAGMLPLPAG